VEEEQHQRQHQWRERPLTLSETKSAPHVCLSNQIRTLSRTPIQWPLYLDVYQKVQNFQVFVFNQLRCCIALHKHCCPELRYALHRLCMKVNMAG
jgi:hypothetical protein